MTTQTVCLPEQVLLETLHAPLSSVAELAARMDADPTSVRRTVRALVKRGLLVPEVVRSVAQAELRYRPSQNAVRAIARQDDCRPSEVAADYGHTERALVALRTRLERVLAARAVCRALRGHAEASEPGAPWLGLVTCWVPARIGRVPVDGVATLSDRRRQHVFALVLDTERVAPHHLLPRLAALGRAINRAAPGAQVLLVPATERRANLLRALLADEAQRGRLPAIAVRTLAALEAQGPGSLLPAETWRSWRDEAPPPLDVTPAPEPERVAFGPSPGAEVERRLARLHGRLTPAALALLDWLADHPLQDAAGLAVALDASAPAVRRLLRLLRGIGVIEAVTTRPLRYALLRRGLELLAVRDGWRPDDYARARGIRLADRPGPGGLTGLLNHADHTLGADGFFLSLLARAARRRRESQDEALVAWEGPAACHRRFRAGGGWRNLRPDGYGVYRADGIERAFHLEWDCGTLRLTQHERKLAAYRAYLDAGAYVPDRGQLPTLLYVFSDPAREASVRRLIRVAFAGLPSVPVLTTNVGMLRAYGPGGPCWRSPVEEGWRSWPGGPPERERQRA